MNAPLHDIGVASLLGLGTTSSSIVGASLGLYAGISKRILACVLAFAAGALISALAIELGYQGAEALRRFGFTASSAWCFISAGFAAGAMVYYGTSLFLEGKGAAVRYATQFREYALARKKHASRERIALLARCDLLRHLPAEAIEEILPCIGSRRLRAGEILFRAGDPGDALYIVAAGEVEVLGAAGDGSPAGRAIARLGEGHAFGEMALLTGGARTATVRAAEDTDLLAIGKADFERLVASDYELAKVIERLSHERAISNLRAGGVNPEIWAKVASHNLDRLSRNEASKLLAEAGKGAGLAIVLGNILDTIPACLVIGAKFTGFETLSLTLMLGMFLGGIPEAAASAAMLRKAGYRAPAIYGLWSTVICAGILAAGAGKAFIGTSDAFLAIFSQAVAGGAVLGLVAHAMIPEAIAAAGSLVVLPTVAGFLFALYLALAGA
ncbi:MAG TPA: cyclic nucleotide-binding domain-containing protein [Xanthobacteraceae bacterium]|nr:cyclic nucleotide-binding domain-containing protein [Xanthobacteraceae bacterium]